MLMPAVGLEGVLEHRARRSAASLTEFLERNPGYPLSFFLIYCEDQRNRAPLALKEFWSAMLEGVGQG